MKRSALQNKQVAVLRMAFQARKVFGTLEKRAPGHLREWALISDHKLLTIEGGRLEFSVRVSWILVNSTQQSV